MLYNINISQIALNDLGIEGLDYDDLAIFNAIEYMHASNKITKQVVDSVQYSLISWKLIKQQLPFLKGNSSSTIKKRIKKLEKAGLIEVCPHNQQLYASYYRMGKNYDNYKIKKEEPYTKVETPLSNLTKPFVKKEEPPLLKMKSNNNINNNNINNNNIIYNNNTYSKNELFNIFYDTYPKKVNKQNALKSWIKLEGKDMIEAIEGIGKFTDGKPKKYISNPQAYINGRRWEDEVIDEDEDSFGGLQELR